MSKFSVVSHRIAELLGQNLFLRCRVLQLQKGQKEIAACAESRFFPLFATHFMCSLMYSLLKIAVSQFLGKIIAIFFCP